MLNENTFTQICMLDAYNQSIHKEKSITITTKIDSACHYYILEPRIIQIGNIREEKNFKNPQYGRIYSTEGISPTIDTCGGGGREPKILEKIDLGAVKEYRIRKLTPLECFRLMGVKDEDVYKIQAKGISNTQQYKLAGNSIVVDNLYYILEKIFLKKEIEKNQQLLLF